MAEAWDPWRELKARKHLRYAEIDNLPPVLGGAVYWPRRNRATIFVRRSEPRVRRRCLLAHELVHDERGGGIAAAYMPKYWKPIVRREEGLVNDIVADRLVPPDELARFCERLVAMDMGVTARDVAVEFDVTDDVAARALNRLARAS